MNRIFRLFAWWAEMPRARRLWLAWGYCFLLIYLLIAPSPLEPFGDWGQDAEEAIDKTVSGYLQHVIAYAGLLSVFWWGYRPKTSAAIWLLIAAAIGHGMLFEALQFFIPSRECDWADLGCDLLGVALAASVIQTQLFWLALPRQCSPESREPQTLANSIPIKNRE